MDSLAFLVFLAQALHASAAATLALVHASLFALWNEPTAPAQVLHDAAFHHFFIEATEETVEGLAFSEFDSHGEITPSIFVFGTLYHKPPSPRGLAVFLQTCDATLLYYHRLPELSNAVLPRVWRNESKTREISRFVL